MKRRKIGFEQESKLIISDTGTKRWLVGRVLHREDGPAVIFYDGMKRWYRYGFFMRQKIWFKRFLRDKFNEIN